MILGHVQQVLPNMNVIGVIVFVKLNFLLRTMKISLPSPAALCMGPQLPDCVTTPGSVAAVCTPLAGLDYRGNKCTAVTNVPR